MKKLILSFLLLFTCISASSCSSFVGDDEDIVIKNVSQEIGVNEKGEKGFYIIIEYYNEDKKPDKFFVPNGKQGETGEMGNGIKSVTSSVDPDSKVTTVVITFTDPKVAPVKYEVPMGVYMTEPTIEKLENGDTKVILNYSDGSKSEVILPKGEKGDTFLGFTPVIKEDGSQELTLHFSGQEPIVITIPAPSKGETGRGIKSILSTVLGDNYILLISYTDGSDDQLEFPRPNTWLTGSIKPNDFEGMVGDFFFDTTHKIIYEKTLVGWKEVIKLETTVPEMFTITFDLNDTQDEPAGLPTGYQLTMEVKEGTYFGIDNPLPNPVRIGYDFDGWYLTKTPTAVNGRFTDTTAVYSDLVLYAKWNKQ